MVQGRSPTSFFHSVVPGQLIEKPIPSPLKHLATIIENLNCLSVPLNSEVPWVKEADLSYSLVYTQCIHWIVQDFEHVFVEIKNGRTGTSLEVLWLRLRASNAGDAGSAPRQGIEGPCATWHIQILKREWRKWDTLGKDYKKIKGLRIIMWIKGEVSF